MAESKDAAGDATASLVTVFGATGQQGGSVVAALAADSAFKVRAVTRNPDSDKAKALPAGVEVVKADLDDDAAVTAAVAGARFVFLVTDFWGILKSSGGKPMEEVRDHELAQGKRVVDAAKAAGVEFVVFSGLEDAETLAGVSVPHFDGKGRVEKHLRESGMAWCSTRMSAYTDVWATFFKPRKQDDGTYVVSLPMGDTPLAVVAAADLGEVVHTILKAPTEHNGQCYGIAGDKRHVSEYTAALSAATGATVNYANMSLEVARSVMGADMAGMFEFYQMTDKCIRDVEVTRRLNPAAKTFAQWVEANKAAFADMVPGAEGAAAAAE